MSKTIVLALVVVLLGISHAYSQEHPPRFAATHVSSYDTEDPVEIGKETVVVGMVRNEGTAACTNLEMVYTVPPGMEFVSASAKMHTREKESSYQAKLVGNKVVFPTIANLPPGEKAIFQVALKALRQGTTKGAYTLRYSEFSREISVEEGTTIYQTARTAPSIHISSYDTEDPIAVGKQTIHVVEVRNEGTIPCQNIRLTNYISQGMQFVDAWGPTKFVAEDNVVVFAPVAELVPGDKLVYRIAAKVTEAGHHLSEAKCEYAGLADYIKVSEGTTSYDVPEK